jgi:uncharacterized protein YlxP (DUF503 family)
MHAAALRLELRIPNVGSLKEKRHKVKALITMLTTKFPVTAGEVGHQNQWRRTTVGVALVAPQAGHLERVINSVHRALLHHPDFELLEIGVSYLEES